MRVYAAACCPLERKSTWFRGRWGSSNTNVTAMLCLSKDTRIWGSFDQHRMGHQRRVSPSLKYPWTRYKGNNRPDSNHTRSSGDDDLGLQKEPEWLPKTSNSFWGNFTVNAPTRHPHLQHPPKMPSMAPSIILTHTHWPMLNGTLLMSIIHSNCPT